MKIKYVQQRYEYDCGIACIAMITEQSYDKVITYFDLELLKKKGLSISLIEEYITRSGFGCIEKRSAGFNDITNERKELWKPFAPIHCIIVKKDIDDKETHAIVMDNRGRLYNPWDKKLNEIDRFKRYYEIVCIMGFFKNK